MDHEHILVGLRKLSEEKPTTKMGQVRWVWREIQGALAAGHTLQFIHQRLNEVGIEIGYRTLSLYVGRLEREQSLTRSNSRSRGYAGEKSGHIGAREDQLVTVATRAGHQAMIPFPISAESGKKRRARASSTTRSR